MFAKLVLLAEDISVDELGRISANKLLLDTFQPSFPCTLGKVDLLTLWTRGMDESTRQVFEIVLQVDGESVHTERIMINFGENYEAYRGISLDGFEIAKPGAIVFRFMHNGEDRAVWVMRAHDMADAPSAEAESGNGVGEA
jgi:hypothetical protein